MREFLKRYKITLKVITPVFIGSGQELSKKEYIYFKDIKEAWILDRNKLMKDIIKRGLVKDFERYMFRGEERLLDWLKAKGYTRKEMQNLCAYQLNCADSLETLNRSIEIKEFIKDAYGMPYIPGSSLKGAIRTSLLGSRILQNKQAYEKVKKDVLECPTYFENEKLNTKYITKDIKYNKKSNKKQDKEPNKGYLKKESIRIEQTAFHTLNVTDKRYDARNDELRGISISDSLPLQPSCLTLCQKQDINLIGKENPINILRESLKPETEVIFELTIDTSVTKITEQEILQALQEVYTFYQNVYVKKFPNIAKSEIGNLYLGGGCGYGTKTVLYELLEEPKRVEIASNLMMLKFPNPKHGHKDDVKRGISPHMLKCTTYNGTYCEMGKVALTITKI